jgi:uncharacterized protein (DUF433 family)
MKNGIAVLCYNLGREVKMEAMEFEATPVPLRMNEHGIIMVGRTRVPLDTVIHAFCRGETPEEIVQAFTTLDLVDVYTIISYYLRHRPEIDTYLERRRQEREARYREIDANFDQVGFRERLLARVQKNG